MSYSLLNFNNVTFEGKLKGMPVAYDQFNPKYTPSKYYEKKFKMGVPARTQDTIYEGLRLYKGTSTEQRFIAKTNKGYISEYKTGTDSIVTILTLKKGAYEVKSALLDENDILTPLKDSAKAKLGIILTLLPVILSDEEAHTIYDTMSDYLEWDTDAEDWIFDNHISEFAMLLNRFSTNMEMRYMYPNSVPSESALTPILVDKDSFIRRMRQDDLKVTVLEVFNGKPLKFQLEQPIVATPTKKQDASFAGSYAYNPDRIFTEEEKNLMATLPSTYVMPDFVPEVCEYFKESSIFPAPMRVAYLVGPAGTGKTEAANAIFSGLGLPGGHYTCNPATEIFDFIGQVFPNCGTDEDISFENIRIKLGLPSTEDVINDPEGSYSKIYGKPSPAFPDEGKIIVDMVEQVMSYMAQNSSGKNFTYVESGLIKAARMGWGFEIQEIGCVLRPGVAVGLNALLETGGNAFITLPTGEVIKKHPDCTFIFTSNDEYEGCCNLNQSVLDRMSLVYRIDNPPETVMKERIMNRLNFPDEKILERMVQVIYTLSDAAKKKGITDGVCGYRSLENWCMATMIKSKTMGYISDAICYQTGLQTVMNKVSQKEEYVEELMSCLTCQFASPSNI